MAIWAIADLHLSFGVLDKGMELFGKQWIDHHAKIKAHWVSMIVPEDLVLIAGDISWAMSPDQALADLEWIDQLPGTKLMIRGNHDYWWTSISKVEKILPPSLHLIQNNAFFWNGVGVAGARLWDTPEYRFNEWIEYQENPKERKVNTEIQSKEETERIFKRELMRLETSLKAINPRAKQRIAMLHYPPIGGRLEDSETSKLLDKYEVDICIFGHLHNVKLGSLPFGKKNRTNYLLTSCDYLEFTPLKIL